MPPTLISSLLVLSALAAPDGDGGSYTAKQYNKVFASESNGAMADIRDARTVALGGGTDRVRRGLDRTGTSLAKRREKVAAMPAFEGDTSLRDEVVSVFDELIALHGNQLTKWADLRVKPGPSQDDARRIATLYTEFEQALPPLTDRLNKAQTAFFRSRGELGLRLDQEGPPEAKQFEAPGVPPDGLALPANLFMSLTKAYEKAHRTPMEEIVGAFNTCADIDRKADPTGYGTCARDAATVCTTAKGSMSNLDEAWFGETTLHKTSLTVADACLSMAESMEKVGAAFEVELTTQEQVDEVNGLIADIKSERQRMNDALAKGQQAWRTRWHLDAYKAYVDEVRGKKAPE